MPETVSDWVLSLLIPLLIVVSGLYAGVSTLRSSARRRRGQPAPGVYPGSPEHRAALEAAGVDSMAGWLKLPAGEQEAADTASLDLAEQAALDAEEHAREAVRSLDLERRAQINASFHP